MGANIKISDNFDTAASEIAAGDAGATAVLLKIREAVPNNWKTVMCAFIDMNLSKSQISAAFKFVGNDMDAFMQAINTRDAKMIEYASTFNQPEAEQITGGALTRNNV